MKKLSPQAVPQNQTNCLHRSINNCTIYRFVQTEFYQSRWWETLGLATRFWTESCDRAEYGCGLPYIERISDGYYRNEYGANIRARCSNHAKPSETRLDWDWWQKCTSELCMALWRVNSSNDASPRSMVRRRIHRSQRRDDSLSRTSHDPSCSLYCFLRHV